MPKSYSIRTKPLFPVGSYKLPEFVTFEPSDMEIIWLDFLIDKGECKKETVVISVSAEDFEKLEVVEEEILTVVLPLRQHIRIEIPGYKLRPQMTVRVEFEDQTDEESLLSFSCLLSYAPSATTDSYFKNIKPNVYEILEQDTNPFYYEDPDSDEADNFGCVMENPERNLLVKA